MIHSIRAKLTLLYIGSLCVLILLFTVIAFLGLRYVLLKNMDTTLYDNAKRVEHEVFISPPVSFKLQSILTGGYDRELARELKNLFPASIVYVQVLKVPDKEEQIPNILARSENLQGKALPLSRTTYQRIRTEKIHVIERVEDDAIFDEPLRLITLATRDVSGQQYLLQLGMSLHSIGETLAHLTGIILILFPLLVLITSFFGYGFMKKAFSPVHRMVTLAENITAEDLSRRIESVNSHDEIGELANTLNSMIARLERSFIQIRQFSGDVSHELKTPLNAIICAIEVALRHTRTGEDYQYILRCLLEETGKLRNIVENLLFLARMDAQERSLALRPLALDEVVTEVYEAHYKLAAQRQITLRLKQVDFIEITGEAGLLNRAFSNLVLNAIMYTEANGVVELSLEQEDNTAIFTVTDTGRGIPEESLPYIFDRFYRADQSRSSDTGGTGIGLAIVKKIVDAHKGHIDVSSKPGAGTRCRIFLKNTPA